LKGLDNGKELPLDQDVLENSRNIIIEEDNRSTKEFVPITMEKSAWRAVPDNRYIPIHKEKTVSMDHLYEKINQTPESPEPTRARTTSRGKAQRSNTVPSPSDQKEKKRVKKTFKKKKEKLAKESINNSE